MPTLQPRSNGKISSSSSRTTLKRAPNYQEFLGSCWWVSFEVLIHKGLVLRFLDTAYVSLSTIRGFLRERLFKKPLADHFPYVLLP